MSLLSPTAGEVVDRITIVALKLQAYRRASKDTEKFEKEIRQLREYLRMFRPPGNVEGLTERLSDINSTIWKAEDEVRAWRSADGHAKLAEFSLRIAKYNDYRSKVIREIDAACGVQTVEEKIYA